MEEKAAPAGALCVCMKPTNRETYFPPTYWLFTGKIPDEGDEMIFFGQSVHSHCIFDIIGNTGILHIIYSLLDRVVPSLCVKFPRGVVYSYRWLRNLAVMVSKARLYLIPWGEKGIEQCSENRKQLLHNFSYSGKIRKWEQEATYNSLKGFTCIQLMDHSANSLIGWELKL